MNVLDIAQMPTVINNNHESLYRCYHTLDKVKGLLEIGTPPDVILEIIETIDRAALERWGRDGDKIAVQRQPAPESDTP